MDVELNAKVVGVDNTGVDIIDSDGKERRIRSRCKVWAAGVSASPLGRQLAEQSGGEVDRAGRVKVNEDLTLPGHPEIFVVGDMMALNNLPGVAQVAMQGGKYAAGQIVRRLRGSRRQNPSSISTRAAWPRSPGSTRSAASASESISPASSRGSCGSVSTSCTSSASRTAFTTVLHWAVSFIFRGRSQRTTTRQQIVARTLMARLSATEEALKEVQEQEAPAIEPAVETSGTASRLPGSGSGGNSHQEGVGTDSVDELTAAYGEKGAEAGEATSVKPTPES